MFQMRLATLSFIFIGGSLTLTRAQIQPCDQTKANQCSCTFDVLLAAYNISCDGNVTMPLIGQRNSTQPIKINFLDLSSNQIQTLSTDFFNGILDISMLDLSNNSLTEIPTGLATPGLSVGELRLGHNQITVFNLSRLAGLGVIRGVDLSHNQITEMTGTLDANTTLSIHNLDLSFNRLVQLDPKVLFYLTNVHSMDLAHNRLHVSDLFPTMATKHLNLSYNLLSSLPDGTFQNLKDLQELILSNNDFQTVSSQWFLGLDNLEVLQLSHNNLSALGAQFLGTLPNLHTLDVTHNRLPRLGSQEFAGVQSRLKTLNLGFNQISDIDKYSFTSLGHLTTLILAGNKKLESIYGILLPPHLAFLDLSNCSITELFECDMKGLVDLKYLHLQGNDLTCDCHMAWLVDWCKKAMDKDLRILTETKHPWTCKSETDSVQDFHTVPLESFVCPDKIHKKQFCYSSAKSEPHSGSNNSSSLPKIEDIDLRMNTSSDTETIISKWSVNPLYPIYGFKFTFSGSEEGVFVSPWIHGSKREYIMKDIVSYTNYNVCISAYHNESEVIATACDQVYVISVKVYVGIMAGMVAIVPCFIALFIVIYKDRGAPKYEQLEEEKHRQLEKETGMRRGLVITTATSTLGGANPHHGDAGSKSIGGQSKEIESYINQSFAFTDESAYRGSSMAKQTSNSEVVRPSEVESLTSDNTEGSSSSPPRIDKNLQCCDQDHTNLSTRL